MGKGIQRKAWRDWKKNEIRSTSPPDFSVQILFL